jgi:hypothetical protein
VRLGEADDAVGDGRPFFCGTTWFRGSFEGAKTEAPSMANQDPVGLTLAR